MIAIEGAEHGILSNTVLPFGFSRMVTETVGDPEALKQIGFLDVIKPELVVPMVVFLASRACEFSHQNYSACAGRFARVFVGLGEGWFAEKDSNPTADDIEAHLSEVSATEPFSVPGSIFEEVFGVAAQLGVTTGSMDIDSYSPPPVGAQVAGPGCARRPRRHPRVPAHRLAGGQWLQSAVLALAGGRRPRSLREEIAELYREAYLMRVGGQLLAELMPAGSAGGPADVVDGVVGREHAKVPLAGNPLLRALLAAHRR